MIERIIEFSIRHRVLVLVAACACSVAGVFAALDTPVDAIPDLSENQVIVFTDWMGRSPREIEDQVTYPLSRKLQGLAGVRVIRSSSEFNFSMLTIIFEDGVDFYFARQRVTEKLAQASTFLPAGVMPYLAPDATSLGQIFWYTLETSPDHPLEPGRLWALNKFYVGPQINAAQGVADVAIVGGTPLEYQVDVRPEDLRGSGVTLGELYRAIGDSNLPAGGGVIQKNNAEYLVRGIGWIKDRRDIENTVIKQIRGTPIFVRNVASVRLGTQFRRGVFEKDGNEVTGGAVLMRHGENPLAVTRRVKEKIQELQSGLPPGVHVVPAYDRTRLIQGAIHTLTDVMWHEMLIAAVAVFLILMHARSVFVICITLPLSVLFSFLLMWLLRRGGIIDIQANIMSLAGITISIGILIDQAIVMTENASHHLQRHFGDRPVSGDTREIVLAPCRTVGRPIFFSVLIMLLSFVPVFMLSGREGKLFHPLAYSKSFAMLGVAIISVTVVPALIPTFIKGRLRGEEANWIVRSFSRIYRPLLTWALPRRNLVMWMFAALLIVAAGIFPLQALLGLGASQSAWKTTYSMVFFVVTSLTLAVMHGAKSRLASLASLVLIGIWAYGLPKIGVSFMPALDEGTLLDMPITVPRASVTEVSDDLKARDALLRGFPEVESVVGKVGRADTPTDPAPLDMAETFVNFRPRELWPRRVLRYDDAAEQARLAWHELQSRGLVRAPPSEADRQAILTSATQKALERYDEMMRELALERYREVERELGIPLTRFAIEETVRQLPSSESQRSAAEGKPVQIARLARKLAKTHGAWLARSPALEDVSRLVQDVARELQLAPLGGEQTAAAAAEFDTSHAAVLEAAREFLGLERQPIEARVLAAVDQERLRIWRERVATINWELFDRGTEAFTWYALEELVQAARTAGFLGGSQAGARAEAFATASLNVQLGKEFDARSIRPLRALHANLLAGFQDRVILWPRRGGPRGDLVDDEMGRVLQVPGWSNIFTQPIINRIEMLSTGVRTDVGVKVFGPNLEVIERVCQEIEAALKPMRGARDTIAVPITGKGYVEIEILREQAAQLGISVADIQNEIELALAGRPVTYTVEQRERYPVRIRYARGSRQDEESIRRLLIGSSMMRADADTAASSTAGGAEIETGSATSGAHRAAPAHASQGAPLVPLAAVANVRIVEGPAMIKSENGRLMNYVVLNVRGRDMVGFVEEAERVVAQKVRLPEGVHIEWSGEFEHQVRASRTLRIVFPAVVLLIFVILYFTYHDLADACLMLLAVPEALAGGAIFMYLFPKIMQGWAAPPLDFSVAVWVGFIACFGIATETGIIMLVYLREAIERRGGLEKIQSLEELRQAIIEGAVHRLRPKLLTEGVAIIAIFPMVFAQSVGGEILAPMALPVLGGLLISDEVVDLFLPVRFYWVRRARWLKLHRQTGSAASEAATPA